MELENLESIVENARKKERSILDEPTGKHILSGYGIAVPKSVVVPEGAGFEASAQLQPPFALKVVSADVVHKTDLGGVRLNLGSVTELDAASDDIRTRVKQSGANIEAWLVEEMAAPGLEVVVGGLQDPEFGPVIMIGLGGVFVEVFEDVAFRICPISRADAFDMVDELKSSSLLKGARGKDPLDIDALVDTMLRVGGERGLLLNGQQHISELDINPLIVSQTGVTAVDARFVLKDGQ